MQSLTTRSTVVGVIHDLVWQSFLIAIFTNYLRDPDHAHFDNDNVFISDLWPMRPNRQLSLYADIHERKIQGYADTQ